MVALRNPTSFHNSTSPCMRISKPVARRKSDEVSGLRYLQPETGRWISRDLIGERGGINLHGFVGNESANHYDALGTVGSDDVYIVGNNVWLNNGWFTDELIGLVGEDGLVHLVGASGIAIESDQLTLIAENNDLTSLDDIVSYLQDAPSASASVLGTLPITAWFAGAGYNPGEAIGDYAAFRVKKCSACATDEIRNCINNIDNRGRQFIVAYWTSGLAHYGIDAVLAIGGLTKPPVGLIVTGAALVDATVSLMVGSVQTEQIGEAALAAKKAYCCGYTDISAVPD